MSGYKRELEEVLPDIVDFTFEEFQRHLTKLRKDASVLEKTLKPANLDITNEENYISCVKNLKERMDLLNKFAAKLEKEEKSLRADIDNYGTDDEKKLELKEAESKLKTTLLFKEAVEVEKKREDFYRKKAIEKYMENYLEIKEEGVDSHR